MKKKIVILLIILIIIGIIGIGGYYLYEKYKQQDPFELEWVNTYYNYMRENHEKLKINQNGLKYYRENEKIEFCEINNVKNPVMLYNYKELGVCFTNVFYINDKNEVKLLELFKKDFNVECLYDIENQDYEYYACEISGNMEKYTKISEGIKVNEYKNNETKEIIDNVFEFSTEEKESVTTLNGELLEISKFNEKFIKTTIVEDNWKDINFDNYEDGIKKDFATAVKNMKKALTEDVKEEVNTEKTEIQQTKEKMARAIQEIEQKKKEEEERRRAEEEARIKAEEEAKKAAEEAKKKEEEERKKREEEQRAQEQETQEQTSNRKLYIKIWNI